MDFFVYTLYKVFKFIVLALPKSLVKIFLKGLSSFIYFVNIEHKRYAKVNLDLVYKNSLSDEEKYKIIKDTYLNIVYNLYEFIENQSLNLEQLEQKIKPENEKVIVDALKNNKKIILVTAHYGNWEYVTSYISLKYKATTVVGRETNNKYFNSDIQNARDKHNSTMLTKSKSAKGLIKALKDDRIVGLATDQHIDPRKGVIVDFLGLKASQVDSTARLACKFDAVIIPVFFIQNDFRDYTVKYYDAIDPKDYEGENQIEAIIQQEANIMSKQILDKPDNWFWQHRRFKEFHKDFYNGKQ